MKGTLRILLIGALCLLMLCASCALAQEDGTPGEAECTHSQATLTGEERENVTFSSLDDGTHRKSFTLVGYMHCDECGTDYEVREEDAYEDEAHTFENGKCTECGYVCVHTNNNVLQTTSRGVYEQVDEWTHRASTRVTTTKQCVSCGHTWTEEEIVAGILREHSFNKEGVCSCGYKNVCTHEHIVSYWDYDYSEESVTVVSYTEYRHTFYADLVEYSQCLDCSTWFDPKVLKSHQLVTEVHDYEGNSTTCWLCGYKKAEKICSHAHVEKEQYIPHYGDEIKFEIIDGQTHRITGDLYEDTYCTDCGKYLNDDSQLVEKNVQRTEEHEFGYGNVCKFCGYVNANPCKHENTVTETDYNLYVNFTAVSETEHSIDMYEMQSVHCADCGLFLSGRNTGNVIKRSEPHYWNEKGVCELCEYAAQKEGPAAEATPAPTAAPTATPTATSASAPESNANQTGTTKRASIHSNEDVLFAPTPEPEEEEILPMVQTLMGAAQAAQEQGAQVSVEIVGAIEVMPAEEYAAMKTLSVQEQILVTLSSIGFDEVVKAASSSMNLTFSQQAQTLREQINARTSKLTEEGSEALREQIAEYFPIEEITAEGPTYSYFVIELRIEVDGVPRIERYGFRLDEESGEWIFVSLSMLEAE